MKKTFKRIVVLSFLLLLAVSDSFAIGTGQAKIVPFKLDSVPNVKLIQRMWLVGNRLCFSYDQPKRWGLMLRTYLVDEATHSLKYDYEYLTNPAKSNGIDYPVLFVDSLNRTYIMDRSYPLIFQLDLEKHTMQNSHKFMLSEKAHVPYAMSMDIPTAYCKSTDEYYFVGRQPLTGVLGIYHSILDSASLQISEVNKIVYSKKYPDWSSNFGKQVFESTTHKVAHGFFLFPAIQIVDLDSKQSRIVKLAEPNLAKLKTHVGDVWDQNIMHIKDITSTSSCIYALWWNKYWASMDALKKKGKANCKIVAISWDGKVKQVYTIPKYVTSIVALAENKLIGTDGKKFWLITLE